MDDDFIETDELRDAWDMAGLENADLAFSYQADLALEERIAEGVVEHDDVDYQQSILSKDAAQSVESFSLVGDERHILDLPGHCLSTKESTEFAEKAGTIAFDLAWTQLKPTGIKQLWESDFWEQLFDESVNPVANLVPDLK